MKIALLQCNPTPNDLMGNASKILHHVHIAKKNGAELCLAPELSLCGYCITQNINRLRIQCSTVLKKISEEIDYGISLILGTIEVIPNTLYNTAFLIQQNTVKCICRKHYTQQTPLSYNKTYFHIGSGVTNITVNNQEFIVTIGNDLIQGLSFSDIKYTKDTFNHPIYTQIKNSSAKAIFCLCSESVTVAHQKSFFNGIQTVAYQLNKPLYFVNHIGVQENRVFFGGSHAIDAYGKYLSQPIFFQEQCIVVSEDNTAGIPETFFDDSQKFIWESLVLGIHDYVKKSGFSDVVLGLSGGIDSSIVAALAVDALGAKHVHGILMPSLWSSEGSITDANQLAKNLNIQTMTLPIHSLMENFNDILSHIFKGLPCDTTEENIQSRIRGILLMALSNKFGWMVLATGNKSELAVGYCTLYGDTCGGLAPIGDLYKTEVYALAYWYNTYKAIDIIPHNILIKAPSAELRPEQTDQESLPPYEELDSILQSLIEENVLHIDECKINPIVSSSIKERFHKNAFKRQQIPPSIIISKTPL